LNKLKAQEEGTMEWLKKFWLDEEGATMPEYALMVALIAVVAMVGAAVLGVNIDTRFNQIAGEIGP
jgi:pilus assembly protein Flp/PilA